MSPQPTGPPTTSARTPPSRRSAAPSPRRSTRASNPTCRTRPPRRSPDHEPARFQPAGQGRRGAQGGHAHRGQVLAPRDAGGARGREGLRDVRYRSEEHTSELQSLRHLVCRLLLEKKKIKMNTYVHPTWSRSHSVPHLGDIVS